MQKTKKIAKKFKNNKQLEKYVKNIDYNYVNIYVQHKERIQDLEFSEIYKDDVIGCSKNSASTGNSGRSGAVALNKKLIEKTSWRLMSHGASLGYLMGIAVIPKDQCQGWMYNLNQRKSGLGQGYYLLNRGGQAYSDYFQEENKITNFQMDNQEWVTLTYDPAANILNFFNENTGNSYQMKIKPQQEDVGYYPVVVLYKATMYQYYFDPDDDLPDDYYDKLYEEHLKYQRQQQELQKYEDQNNNRLHEEHLQHQIQDELYNNHLIEDHYEHQRQEENEHINRLINEHLQHERQVEQFNNQLIENHFERQRQEEDKQNNQLYKEHLELQIQKDKQEEAENELNNQLYEEYLEQQIQQARRKDTHCIQNKNNVIANQIDLKRSKASQFLIACKKKIG